MRKATGREVTVFQALFGNDTSSLSNLKRLIDLVIFLDSQKLGSPLLQPSKPLLLDQWILLEVSVLLFGVLDIIRSPDNIFVVGRKKVLVVYPGVFLGFDSQTRPLSTGSTLNGSHC